MRELRTAAPALLWASLLLSAFVVPAFAQDTKAAPAQITGIDDLPHRPLPAGKFMRWCGRDGYVLMAKKARPGTASSYWIQGRSDKVIVELAPTKGLVECDRTGAGLLINESSSVKGLITRFDIKQRTTSIVATYATNQFAGGNAISISPDQKYVAFDSDLVWMNQDEQTGGLKLVSVAHSSGFRIANSLRWSADSSSLLNVVVLADDPKNPKRHQEALQLIDVSTGKETIDNLPPDTWFESGVVLEGGKGLLLFLRPSQNEIRPEPGAVVTCTRAPALSCRALISDVDEVSFSDDGKIASVKEVMKNPKVRTDGDSIVVPIAFVTQIRDSSGKLIASQRFTRKKEQWSLHVLLSPTASEAALIWEMWSGTAKEVGQSASIVSVDVRPTNKDDNGPARP